ncbi:MAG: DUF4838 domain-containing protein [Bacteroidetes bacterium]|nr:DUF4838 domain-containing protein [Bacteroidota bacterium]
MQKKIQTKIKLNLLLLCIVFSHQTNANNKSKFTISYPHEFPTEVVANLQTLLEKLTHEKWNSVEGQSITCGFCLTVALSDKFKTGESCIINANGKDLVQFKSPTIKGLIFGVYRYLRNLGFNFYLPDELYTVIPKNVNLFAGSNITVTPYLRIRDFFGTGGFGDGKTDPDKSVQQDWQLWKWQNGLGSEFSLDGHVGETFNLDNAAVLEKNPSWTASPIKTNGRVNVETKLNYFNADAVNFFTDWVIRKFTDKNYKKPASFIRDMVSVEPADGGNFMSAVATVNGVKLQTVSDQVFYAANVAAQKLDKLFPGNPGIGVSLYAYSQHADVPSFPLHPRVFVQIIPYQFQNIAFGPAFIKRWSEKVKRFGLYDYYKYPDSYMDQPGGYTLDELMNRALHAARAGSEGTTYESSYSKFATGVQLWVLACFMADGDSKWISKYNNFISALYGRSAVPVKKIFDLFYRQPVFDAIELKSSLKLLAEAESLNKDAVISKRLEELKLYLIFVHLQQASKNLKNGNLEQLTLPVFKMAWTLYEKKIVHSFRIMQLISYGFLNNPGTDEAMKKRHQLLHLLTFPETTDTGALWKKPPSVSQYQPGELNRIFADTSKESELLKAEPVVSVSLPDILKTIKQSYNAAAVLQLQGNNNVRGYMSFYNEKPVIINVNYELSGSNPQSTVTISGTNTDYTTVLDKKITDKKGSFNITLPVGKFSLFANAAANTTYRLTIRLNNAIPFFEPTPRGKMAFLDKKGDYGYSPDIYPCYFYVPPQTSEIIYSVQGNALSFYSPEGKKIENTLIETHNNDFETRSIKIKPSPVGRIWKAVVSGNFNYQLLNIPDRWFYLQPK